MHYFDEKSQYFASNFLNYILILQNWEKPKYSIGQLIEYQDESDEKGFHKALIRGCKYYLYNKAWKYEVIDFYASHLHDGFDGFEIKDSQIVTVFPLAEINELSQAQDGL
jgi:hypothetical protein